MSAASTLVASEPTTARRVADLDWKRIECDLDEYGWSLAGQLLSTSECRTLIDAYDDPDQYRSRVVMARHNFGQGEYKYYDYPLPELIADLRSETYSFLMPIANRWAKALGADFRYPRTLSAMLKRCRDVGQIRPTPLILRYQTGDYNCLHQDLYGELSFPLQLAVLLSRPGADFHGGELVLTEQRPRMQSRAHVVPLGQGECVVLASNERPIPGKRGYYRVKLRHGVSSLRAGNRHVLGIIFHDAR